MPLSEYNQRFIGVESLYGSEAAKKLSLASVCVVGLGGVGCWIVEALVRSGIGAITLVDFDDICITNTNRQLHADTTSLGKLKTELLAERISKINPECRVTIYSKPFCEKSSEEIFSTKYDVVVDAIDRVTNKCLLISLSYQRGIPIVVTGSAGDRRSASSITVTDLSKTVHDPLLSYVRKKLRQDFNFPRSENRKFEIRCVYVPMQRNSSKRLVDKDCSVDSEANDEHGRRTCQSGLGTAVFVTGSIGFFAAGEVVEIILNLNSAVAVHRIA